MRLPLQSLLTVVVVGSATLGSTRAQAAPAADAQTAAAETAAAETAAAETAAAETAAAETAATQPSAAQTLARVLDEAPHSPELAVACAPAQPVLSTLGAALESISLDPGSDAVAALLAAPATLVHAGIDPSGPMALSLWQLTSDPAGVLRLPFAGDDAAAERFLEGLGAAPQRVGAGSWRVVDAAGEVSEVTRVDGSLTLAFGTLRQPAVRHLPQVDDALVSGLPAQPGCTAWLALPGNPLSDERMPQALPRATSPDPEQGFSAAAFVGFARTDTAVLRLSLGQPLPAPFSLPPAAPVTGSSTQPPSLVLTLGISLSDLLASQPGQDALTRTFDLSDRQARRLARKLNLGAGATVAFFGQPRAFDIVLSLPLDATRGPTRVKPVLRRLERLLKRGGFEILSRSPDGLVFVLGGTPTSLRAIDGRLYLGPDATRVAESADGRGQPWVGADALAWSLRWPVAAWTGPETSLGGGMVSGLRLGLRGDEDLVEIGAKLRTNAPPGMLGAAVAAMLSDQLGDPGPGVFGGDSRSSAADEVERALDDIARAQEVHLANSGSYLALSPAPRPREALDDQPAAWAPDADWKRLGWSPGTTGTTAVFWVELTDGGYAVYAETDLDGDGQPARYMRSNTAPMKRLSPEGVQ